jgi:GcrA cell cycle regulator
MAARNDSTCSSSWTPPRVERLTALWRDGLSANQIARDLGGVTRNGVIGKVHRLGLSGRDTPTTPGKAKAVPLPKLKRPAPALRVIANAQTFVEPEPRPARAVVPERHEGPGRRTVMTIAAFECRWPIGEPQDPDFTLCGRAQSADGGSYCVHHAAIATVPLTPAQKNLNRSLRRYVAA